MWDKDGSRRGALEPGRGTRAKRWPWHGSIYRCRFGDASVRQIKVTASPPAGAGSGPVLAALRRYQSIIYLDAAFCNNSSCIMRILLASPLDSNRSRERYGGQVHGIGGCANGGEREIER
jgi:hypothetical protein